MLLADQLGLSEKESEHAQPLLALRPKGAQIAVTVQRNSRSLLAEPDESRVAARPRREALRPDVQRLEEVRLARAVRAHDEDEARREIEIEPRIGAEVSERRRPNDQPASRIGMIRYQKSSLSP